MKRILSLLSLTILFAVSCKESTTENGGANKDIAASYEPMIQGSWVMTDYISSLQQTGSALASSNLLKDIVSLDIDTKEHSGDSASVAASLNNHEGYAFYIYFRKGHEEGSLLTNHTDGNGDTYELGYAINNNDTSLVMYHYDKDGKLLNKRGYTHWKEPVADTDEPSGIQRAINKALFAGKYKVTDEAGKTADWEFTNGGNVTGAEGFTTYYVFSDFIAEQEGYLIDEIDFNKGDISQKPFIYVIKGDTTYLYQAKENADRTKMERGTLKYTMIKQ